MPAGRPSIYPTRSRWRSARAWPSARACARSATTSACRTEPRCCTGWQTASTRNSSASTRARGKPRPTNWPTRSWRSRTRSRSRRATRARDVVLDVSAAAVARATGCGWTHARVRQQGRAEEVRREAGAGAHRPQWTKPLPAPTTTVQAGVLLVVPGVIEDSNAGCWCRATRKRQGRKPNERQCKASESFDEWMERKHRLCKGASTQPPEEKPSTRT